MQMFSIVINKLLEVLSIRITFGSYSFTLFQLQLFFMALALIGYFVGGLLEKDD